MGYVQAVGRTAPTKDGNAAAPEPLTLWSVRIFLGWTQEVLFWVELPQPAVGATALGGSLAGSLWDFYVWMSTRAWAVIESPGNCLERNCARVTGGGASSHDIALMFFVTSLLLILS